MPVVVHLVPLQKSASGGVLLMVVPHVQDVVEFLQGPLLQDSGIAHPWQ
jgi:hypothetical protein